MRLMQGVLLLAMCLLTIIGACRRNTPSLVDTNQPPETVLWYAPPDSSEHEYTVHLYWRGEDRDGVVERYIWTIQDTLNLTPTMWNPLLRLRDLRSGRFIETTDSIFSFTAYRNVSGIGVKRNRQAFYIAAVDDNGAIDPFPAAVEFIATIDKLPTIRFHLDTGTGPPQLYTHDDVPDDTVGVLTPFTVTYSAKTTNGHIEGYYWFPLGISIDFPGANMWNEDLGDTILNFTNSGNERLPAGVFRLAAKGRDSAGAESEIDSGRFRRGVVQVVVNFDPDTRIHLLTNNYAEVDPGDPSNLVRREREIDFTDSEPDTLPMKSYLRIDYSGWDDRRDAKSCALPTINPDRCIKFQLRYEREAGRIFGSFSHSGWLPRGQVHDTDSTSATDSNSVNIASLEYDFFVRSVDENGTSDGTPAHVSVIGNYDPVLDGVALEDHRGRQIDISGAVVDTLTWNWWRYRGWPTADTIMRLSPPFDFRLKKTFEWRLRAWGHDDPKDTPGTGIGSWQYFVRDQNGKFWGLARSGETWFNSKNLNVLGDTLRLTFIYGNRNIPNQDVRGDSVFTHLPGYFDKDITIFKLRGRDSRVDDGYFDQFVFYGIPPDGEKASHGVATKHLINSFPSPTFGRWTEEKTFTFHFRMVR